jgi:hypothetical protein
VRRDRERERERERERVRENIGRSGMVASIVQMLSKCYTRRSVWSFVPYQHLVLSVVFFILSLVL